MDLDIRIFFFYHKPQLVIKMFLTLKIGCSVHEFILLLSLMSGIIYSAVYESFIKMYIFDRISRITKFVRCLSQEK
jgi:hypothetical protein